mmetsp:Transcript_17764/g.49568  ORF Transcript_17764/g.49568 Transcript_17764/m.49568 type:complete len:273 (-) Transcript_17764:1440-2258(-)
MMVSFPCFTRTMSVTIDSICASFFRAPLRAFAIAPSNALCWDAIASCSSGMERSSASFIKKSASRRVAGLRLSSSAISAMNHARAAFWSFKSEPRELGEGNKAAGLASSGRRSTLAISSPWSARSAGLKSLKVILKPSVLAQDCQSPYTWQGGSAPSGKGDLGPVAQASNSEVSFKMLSALSSQSFRFSMAARFCRFFTSAGTVRSGLGRQLRFCSLCDWIHQASNSSSSTLPPPSVSTCLKMDLDSSLLKPARAKTCSNSSSSRLPVPSSS